MAARKKPPTLNQYNERKKHYMKLRSGRTPKRWNELMELWAMRVTADIRNIEKYLKSISAKTGKTYVPKP